MTLLTAKQLIWDKCKRNLVTLQVAADKANVRLPITSQHEADKLLESLDKKVNRKKATVPVDIIKRFNDAHHTWFKNKLPLTFNDGHYLEPKFPDTGTSNGLTNFIVDYLTWLGHFANRTGNEGRVLPDGTRIPSSSKNGMQDIDTNLKHPKHPFGIPWKIEIKIGKDTHKSHQKKFGELVKSTGAHYSVVKTVEDFLEQYDELIKLQ